MIIEFSNLRLFGALAGLLLLASIVLDLRKDRVRRVSRLPFILFSFVVISVSLAPGLVEAPAKFIGLDDIKGGRILALLLVSALLVWPLALRNRSRLAEVQINLLATIRNFARLDFESSYAHSIPSGTVWVIIPVFNEAENIPAVLDGLPEDCDGTPITPLVVNDGSTDESAEVARAHGAYVANLPFNCGGGAALKVGFDLAIAARASTIVTMDGDGQHDAKQVPGLVAPIARGDADVVIGSRVVGEDDAYLGLRKIGVRVFSRLINALTGSRITDCSSGFRAATREILIQVPLLEPQYHTPELIIGASKRGAKIQEVPVRIKARLSGESKKGADLRYGWRFARSIVRAWLR